MLLLLVIAYTYTLHAVWKNVKPIKIVKRNVETHKHNSYYLRYTVPTLAVHTLSLTTRRLSLQRLNRCVMRTRLNM